MKSDNGKSGGFYGAYGKFLLLTENDRTTGHRYNDEIEPGRKKIIHSLGAVAQGKFVWQKNNYTGAFNHADQVLLRVSLGTESDGKSILPAMAVKFLRDNVYSGNAIFMYDLRGHSGLNFFTKPFANYLPIPKDLPFTLRLGAKKFGRQSHWPGQLGLSDLAAANQDGTSVSNPQFPYLVVLQPNPAVTKLFAHSTDTDVPSTIAHTLNGTEILYRVFAIDYPGSTHPIYLGYIQLVTPFITTIYGDHVLFFRHTFIEQTYALRPQWQKFMETKVNGSFPPESESAEKYRPYLPPWN